MSDPTPSDPKMTGNGDVLIDAQPEKDKKASVDKAGGQKG